VYKYNIITISKVYSFHLVKLLLMYGHERHKTHIFFILLGMTFGYAFVPQPASIMAGKEAGLVTSFHKTVGDYFRFIV